MRKTGFVVIALAVVVCMAGCPRSGQVWTKPGTAVGQEIVGPDGGTLVWVPAGSFRMGSTDEEVQYAVEKLGAEAQWLADEQPARQVEMDGFWIGKHEVTNAQYRKFCGVTGRHLRQGDNRPVVVVDWDDAVAYCEHYGLSLPTEAQWEYAARGPESRVFPWGNEWDETRLCWRYHQGPGGKTFGVGSFPQGASWCGALDLAGNVWEWCTDWYESDYYKDAPSKNPPGATTTPGPFSMESKVLRGGSWFDDNPRDFLCANDRYRWGLGNVSSIYRCANRCHAPGTRNNYDNCGFRCARGF